MRQRHFCKSLVIALPLLLAASLRAADGPGLSFHLSPARNDANPGTAAQPLATLAAAQQGDPINIRKLPTFKPRVTP